MSQHLVVLQFLKPGMYTTIQDRGRAGHQDAGIPVGGVLDKASAEAANRFVENDPDEPVLEITMKGPRIKFSAACQVAMTGAEMNPELNDREIPQDALVDVPADAVLSFGKLRSGCRAYLAVRGKWQVNRWLGSAAALTVGETDLVPDSVIHKDAVIRIETAPPLPVHHPPVHTRLHWPDNIEVRVLPGPEFKVFSAEHIAFFFNTVFKLTAESNRIGCRLLPELPDRKALPEMISSGVIPGTVQVTRQGQPVILMADAQTTGGYLRIANVLTDDLNRLAQLKPGDSVKFQIVRRKANEE